MQTFDAGIKLTRPELQDLLRFEQQPAFEDFSRIFKDLMAKFGLRNVVYYSPTLPQWTRENPFVLYTYSEEWAKHYQSANYQPVDPVLSAGARSLLPVAWENFTPATPKVVKLFDESRQAGMGANGLTIPVRGVENGVWGSFSVTSDEGERAWRKQRAEILADLVLAAHFLHQKAYDLHRPGEVIDLNSLTRRETEALSWTAEGKSISDIATLMGISMETVKAHLDSARFKLRALNRVHAVAKAIRHGLIR